jgi:hypothetical protein
MAYALIVLLVPIALLVGLMQWMGSGSPRPIDPSEAFDSARSARAFTVLAPEQLGDGWSTISASFRRTDTGATLRVGYVTPSGAGVQLVESSEPFDEFARRELGDRVEPRGTTTIQGSSWQLFRVRDGEYALVLAQPDRTVLVLGRAEEAELIDLADALR